MREQIAEITMRSAAQLGGSLEEAAFPRIASFTYRIAGFVVMLMGGRLETRVISFAIPDGDPVAPLTSVLDTVAAALADSGIHSRLAQRQLSREEALAARDTVETIPDGVEVLTLHELFVPTHAYRRAARVVGRVMARVHESDRE